jgi:hypothetical protein
VCRNYKSRREAGFQIAEKKVQGRT